MSGAVDFSFLESFLGGDLGVAREVLEIFLDQARTWEAALQDGGDRDLFHAIKGASRGIGANRLGDAADAAEREGLTHAADVRAALQQTVAAIQTYLGNASGV